MKELHTPTIEDIQAARNAFETNEPRDLFYRAATELVDLSIQQKTSLSVTEAVAVLLQTWNQAYYRYRKFDNAHYTDIETLMNRYKQVIMAFRQRTIDTFSAQDKTTITEIFNDFGKVLGPVGAAKCLHLLAPSFFPLWDRKITQSYSLNLQRSGTNGPRYCRFMKITQAQCHTLGGEQTIGRNPLKALDEYNYCKYTRGWI